MKPLQYRRIMLELDPESDPRYLANSQPGIEIDYTRLDMNIRRYQILGYMVTYWKDQQNPPSTCEIAKQFEITQTTAYRHLITLVAEGYLKQTPQGRWKIPGALYVPPEGLD